MQNLRINPGLLPETIHIPSSKSYANRALILSALKPGKMTLHHLPKASDVTFLIDGLRQIGLQIDCLNETAVISNSFPHCERSQGNEIFVGEGGTTARFLASLLSNFNIFISFFIQKYIKKKIRYINLDVSFSSGD